MSAKHPALAIDVTALFSNKDKAIGEVLHWAVEKLKASPVLIYASAPPEKVSEIQSRFGGRRRAQ